LTFASPRLTILNGTRIPLPDAPRGPLQDHAIRFPRGNYKFQSRIEPQRKHSVGLLVDLNLNTIVTNALGVDFSAANALSVTQTR